MSSQHTSPMSGESVRSRGTLLGVVLDLSGSMYESIRNETGGHLSRIEGLAQAFGQVTEDAQLFLKEHVARERLPVRLFIYGFGFWCEEGEPSRSAVGDVLAVLASLHDRVKHYHPLQSEVESLWSEEVARVLEERKIAGNAKDDLRAFVEHELKEQAILAEQQRSAAKFQRWCASTCQRLSERDSTLRKHIAHSQGWERILLPLAVGLLWLLRGPALALALLNRAFEAWLRRKLADLRTNAHIYAVRQAEKVVTVTRQALDAHHRHVAAEIEASLIAFLDREAFNTLRLYNAKSTALGRKQAFNREALRQVDEYVAQRISQIMSPHANVAWNRSVFLLKQAARVLHITPNWAILKEYTIRCAHQVAWEALAPEVQSTIRALAKSRFTRAVLMTVVRETKDQRETLALEELIELIRQQDHTHISVDELPIFGPSPLGHTLNQTFMRLQAEVSLPHNEGLLPAILLISDGKPTDFHELDVARLAENIKQRHIPIVCCFVTNRNVSRPWVMRRRPGWFWPQAARLMFSMASSVEEWPQLGERLVEGRFVLKKQARFFLQINHTGYLRNFIEAMLLPVQRERYPGRMGKVPTVPE
jgi:hypothetical protein